MRQALQVLEPAKASMYGWPNPVLAGPMDAELLGPLENHVAQTAAEKGSDRCLREVRCCLSGLSSGQRLKLGLG